MTTSSAVAERELTWECPADGRGPFVLHADGAEIGRLTFEKEMGSHSAAEYGGRRWTLEHSGYFHPHVTVRSADTGAVIAEFVPHLTGGGIVSFKNGPHFHWTRVHLWSDRWCFRCKANRSAVCVTQEADRLASGGRVSVCADAAHLPDGPVLVLLAWYLRLLDFERLENDVEAFG